jgi:5'-3' exoribonuclease 2
MGVPAFFRWLSTRYSRIIINASERLSNETNVQQTYEESIEKEEPLFDNFYIDMNGIIHPCCHPEEGIPPQNEAEMFNNMFAYIDKLMKIVRPRKVLYLAIDGVAPRAKMNQQRSRRFRAAIDSKLKAKKKEELKRIWEKKGENVPSAMLNQGILLVSE